MQGGLVTVRKLNAKNLVSYPLLSLVFHDGMTAIVGPNGAGKSSIVDGMLFALTGKSPRGASLLRRGAGRGDIELELVSGDSSSIVVRLQFVEGERDVRVAGARLMVNGKLEASKKEAVIAEVKRLLGLAGVPKVYEFLSTAVIVRQGVLRDIAQGLENPKRLREILDSALGSRALVEAADKIGDIIFTYRDEATGEQVYAKPGKTDRIRPGTILTRESDALIKDRERLAKVREEASRVEREIEEAEAKLRELEALVAEAEDVKRALESDVARLRERKARLEESLRRLSRLRQEARKLEEEVEELKRAAVRLERVAEAAVLKPLVDEARRLEARLAEARARLSAALRLRQALARVEELRRTVEELRGADVEHERLQSEVKRLAAERESVAGRLAELERAARQVHEAAKRLGVRAGSPLEALEALESLAASLEAEAEKLRAEAERLAAKAEALEAERLRAERALELLESSRPEAARCPLCGSPLTGARLEEVRRHLEEEAERLAREVEEAYRRAREAKSRARLAEERAGRSRGALEKARGALAIVGGPEALEELGSVRERLFSIEKELRRAEAALRAAAERAARLREAEGRLRDAKAEVFRAAQDLGLKAPPGLGEAEELVRGLEAEVRGLEERLKRVLEEVRGLGAGSLEEAERLAAEAERARVELARVRSLLEEKLERLRQVREEAESLGAVEEEHRRVSDELARKESELREAEEALREAQAERAREAERLGKLRGSLEALAAEEARLRARINLRGKLISVLTTAIAVKRILVLTREEAYKRALRALEDEMNRVLSRFALPGILSVSFADTPEGPRIRVADRTGREAPVSSLSGGEKTVLALSFILALNRAVGGRIGFLVLDEPTAELDEDRRRELISVLREASSQGLVRQLILVTHHEDVIDQADVVCRVERGADGRSSVTCS